MSTTIDTRVVEMRFDNKHFESNVSTTMSTLDKLKDKLGFKGATKGLEDISTSAKRVDLTPLSNSVEQVGLKFNALYSIADQALRNITNSAINTGKRLISSLSVDQIMAGWDKYDKKTANVQTLVNATGLGIDEVNSYLEKLMWFSDETSYAFTDMTAGLATMVSSGGDIKKLVPLLMGVANATAFAGKGAAEFSRVLQYGVNQAYSLGYMQVQDWKTIEGATVNSKQLMQTLIDAGVALKEIEKGEITTSNFRNSLKDKWLTKEVMELGFGQFAEATEKAYGLIEAGGIELAEELKLANGEVLEAGWHDLDTASDAYTILEALEKQAQGYKSTALTAAQAAQEAKTFTEAIDATKDAVSSGWMKTFELIFGNYEQAKVLWTELANTLWDVFAAGAEVRNWIIDTALNFAKPWEAIAEKLGKVSDAVDKVTTVSKKFKSAGEAVEYYQKIVSSVWRGNWKRSDTGRYKLLEEAGYDHRVVQDLVNLGSRHKITIEDIEASHKKFGLTIETSAAETQKLADSINHLTDEQLIELGLTEDEIEIYKELAAESERTGESIESIADKMAKNDGRTLLIDGFKNLGSVLRDTFYSIKDAWDAIFPPMSFVRLYNLIEAFNKFTEKLRLTDKDTGEYTETALKLQRILKGVFAIVDIITTIMGGAFKVVWKIAIKVLESFGVSVLDVLAWVGDLAVKLRDWFDSLINIDGIADGIASAISSIIDVVKTLFTTIANSKTFGLLMYGIQHIAGFLSGVLVGALELIADALAYVIDAVKGWIEAISQTEGFKKFVEYATTFFTWLENTFGTVVREIGTWLTNVFSTALAETSEGLKKAYDAVNKWFTALKQNKEFNEFVECLSKIYNWVKDKIIVVFDKVRTAIKNAASSVTEWVDAVKNSNAFKAGGDLVSGFVIGLKNGVKKVWNAAVDLAKAALNGICDFLGIHSPATKGIEAGEYTVEGFWDGLLNGIKEFDWTKIGNAIWRVSTLLPNNNLLKLLAVASDFIGLFLSKIITAIQNTDLGDSAARLFGGLANGLKKGAGSVFSTIADVGKKIIDSICNVLGIHSPSTEMEEVGHFTVQGLLEGIKNFNWSQISAVLWSVSSFFPSAAIINVLAAAANFVGAFADKFIEGFKNCGIGEASGNVISGLVNGLQNGAGSIFDTIINIGKGIINWFCKILGIHSPSVIMFAIGGFLIAGAINGMKDGSFKLWDTIADIGTKLLNMFKSVFGNVVDFISNLDIGTVIAAGFGIAILLLIKNLIDALKGFSKIGTAFSNLTSAIKGFGKPSKTKNITKMITTIAFAFMTLAASLFLISKIPADRLWPAFGALSAMVGLFIVLVGALTGLEVVLSGLPGDKGGMEKLSLMLLGIAGAIALITFTVYLLGNMDSAKAEKGFEGLAKIVAAIVALMVTFGLFLRGDMSATIDKAGGTLIKISIAIMLLVMVAKSIAKIPEDKLSKGLTGMLGFVGIVALLMLATKLVGPSADKIGGTMLSISFAMMVLVMVSKSIAKIPTEDLKRGLSGMLGFVGIIGALMLVSRLAGKNVDKVAGPLFGIAAAMLVMGIIVKLMGKMDESALKKGLGAVTWLTVLVGALIGVTRFAGGPGTMKSVGSAMIGIATAIGILALITALMGLIDPKIIHKGIAIVTYLATMVGLLIVGLRGVKSCTGTMVMLAVIITLLAGAVIGLSFLDKEGMLTAAVALGALIGMLAVLMVAMRALKSGEKTYARNIQTLIALTGVIVILGGVLTGISFLDPKSALPNAIALSALMLALTAAMVIISKAKVGKDTWKAGLAIAGLGLVVLELGAILALMKDWGIGTTDTLATVGVLTTMLYALIPAAVACALLGDVLGKNLKGGIGMAIVIGGIAALGLVVVELGYFLSKMKDWGIGNTSTLATVGVLSTMLYALVPVAAACALLGNAMSKNLMGGVGMAIVIGGIAALGLVVLELGYFLSKMKDWGIGTTSMLATVGVISALLVVLTLVVTACSALGAALASTGLMGGVGMAIVIGGIAALGAVVLELGYFLHVMDGWNIGDKINDVLVLSTLLGVLTLVVAACVGLGLAMTATGMTGSLGLVVAVFAIAALGAVALELGYFLHLMEGWNIGSKMDDVKVLAAMLGTLTLVLAALTIIGFVAPAAMAGTYAFITLIGALEAMLFVLGGLMTSPIVKLFVETGIEALKKLAKGLGEAFSEFGKGLTSGLPQMGEDLSKFAEGLDGFLTTISNVDKSVVDKAGTLAAAVLALCGGDLMNTISDFFKKEDDVNTLEQLGKSLSSFATNAKTFISAMDGMKPETATNLSAFSSAVKDLNDVVGNNNLNPTALSGFGTSMESFAESVRSAAASLYGLTDDDVAAIKRAAAAATAIAELNNAIPKTGGIWQDIAGEQNLAEWGKKISAFADSLVAYSIKVSGKNIDKEAIEKSTAAATSLATLNKDIPKAGGLWQAIAGEQDIADWGRKISSFATSLVNYSTKVSGKNIDKEAIIKSCEAAKELAAINDAIPESDGVWQWLTGEKDLSVFGKGLTDFADGLVNYSTKALEVKNIGVEPIQYTATLLDEIKKVCDKVPTIGFDWGKGIADPLAFGKGINSLADGLYNFCTKSVELNALGQTAINGITFAGSAIEKMTAVVNSIPEDLDVSRTGAVHTCASNLEGFCKKIHSITTAGYDFSGFTLLQGGIESMKSLVSTIDEEDLRASLSTIEGAASYAKGTADAIQALNDKTYGGVKVLNAALDELADANVDGVIKAFSGKDQAVKTGIDSIINAMKSAFNSGASDVKDAATAAANAGVAGVNSTVGSYKTAGEYLVEALSNAIQSKSSLALAKEAAMVLGNSAAKAARLNWAPMAAAGIMLGQGLVNGIKLMMDDAYDAGFALGQAAVRGEKKGQDSASPSKLTIQAGKWLGEGLIIGMEQMGKSVYSAGSTLGETSVDALRRAISDTPETIDKDLVVRPTITDREIDDENLIAFTSAYQVGHDLGEGYVKGAESMLSLVRTIGYALGIAGIRGIQEGQDSHSPSVKAQQEGEYLGTGYIGGVNSMLSLARNAGYALGAAGVKGIQEGQNSHSPSVDGEEQGAYLAEGYANGIEDNSDKAFGAVETMVTTAIRWLGANAKSLTDKLPGFSTLLFYTKADLGKNGLEAVKKTRETIQQEIDESPEKYGIRMGIWMGAMNLLNRTPMSGLSETLGNTVADAVDSVDWSNAFGNTATEFSDRMLSTFRTTIPEATDGVTNAITDTMTEAVDSVDWSNTILTGAANVSEGLAESMTEGMTVDQIDTTAILNNLNEIIAQITKLIDCDTDVTPTIRPVLDLTDLKEGIVEMNALLGSIATPTLSVAHTITIRTDEAQHNEIIQAIDDANKSLGTKIDNISKPSYIIDGITYDDGSNIADAVAALVRAAKIEGRV